MKPIRTELKLVKTRNHNRVRKVKVTGYVIHETDKIVVIATLKTKNRKTGNMVQIWILNRHESPVASVKSGSDVNICFDCPHRSKSGKGFKKRACYVNVGQGPQRIWVKYVAGGYEFLPVEEYARVFGGRAVRFGAYGEPVLIPVGLMEAIRLVSKGRTGYTHQWRRDEFQAYKAFVMASCDSEADQVLATGMGWRTFRVRGAHEPLLAWEISCPASDEMGHRTSCAQCRLCDGATGSGDARKNIVIVVHGAGAKSFVPLTSILPVAA
jgi:hypothetical protein